MQTFGQSVLFLLSVALGTMGLLYQNSLGGIFRTGNYFCPRDVVKGEKGDRCEWKINRSRSVG